MSSAPVCRYFVQSGKCFYGAECKFSHDVATNNAALGSDVPAAAAAAALDNIAAAPQASPKSSLAAHAKEWTPSVSSASFTPGLGTVPAAAATAASNNLTSSPVPTTKLAGLKLNPNKTPFKPFFPSGDVQEFVPASEAAQQHQQEQALDPETGLLLGAEEVYDEQQYIEGDESAMDAYAAATGGVVGVVGGAPLSTYTPSIMSAQEFNQTLHPKTYEELSKQAGSGAHTSLLGRNSSTSSAWKSSPFMDDALRQRFMLNSHLLTARLLPEDPAFATLPLTLDQEHYHSLLPLPADAPPKTLSDANASYSRTAGGSVSYKVTSAFDGRCYVVKRIPLLSTNASHTTEEFYRDALSNWIDFSSSHGAHSVPNSFQVSLNRNWGAGACHPHLVAPRGVFLTKDFGPEFPAGIWTGAAAAAASNAPVMSQVSICVVYDYHPTAGPLHPPADGQALPMELVWHYSLQLIQTLADLHEGGLSASGANVLSYGRILVTNDQTLHLSCSGVTDIIKGSIPKLTDAELLQQQMTDFHQLAALILSWVGFTSKIFTSGGNVAHVYKEVREELSTKIGNQHADLLSLLDILTKVSTSAASSSSSSSNSPSAVQSSIHGALWKRFSTALRTATIHTHFLEHELSKEVQNGRLFRLLVKFGFVCDRSDMGASWSDTGDRYLLSLFRDLLFHSMHTSEVPNMDWGHVIHNLNKLDAGSPEKILLSSRTGESMLLVRFSDLKRCVELSYEELVRKQAEGLGAGGMAIVAARQQQQQMQEQMHGRGAGIMRSGKPSIMQREK